MKKIIDLSHIIEDGMTTYMGLPEPKITDYLSREESKSRYAVGTTFQIGKINMVANTGTYIDAPFHRYAEGNDISEFNLTCIANLDGAVFHSDPAERTIKQNLFKGHDIRNKAVLIHTGWDRYWGAEQYFENHPFLDRLAVQSLRSAGVKLVGIDSLNIDDNRDGTRPAHTILLDAGIPIVEHLCNLEKLPDIGFKFFAVPPPVKGMGSFPVRAFALI